MSAGYPTFQKSIYERIQGGEWTDPKRPNRKYCEEFGKDWKVEMAHHRFACAAVRTSFKEACLEDVGLTGHEKADKAFNYAWMEGHSSGLYEVYQVLCDITELVL